jgi:DNA-binding NarL/FixJ family response regulator
MAEGQRMTDRARVLIVDDHPLVREGLAARISAQPDMQVCGEAASVDEALVLLDTTRPALIVVDLALKGGHGLKLIKNVSQASPETRMLVVSAYEESLYGERVLHAGAHGYVNKQEAQQQVVDAIRVVLRGERYLSAELTQRLVERAVGRGARVAGIDSLSDREIEIFELIGRGESTRSIAERLRVSVHTIESHRENIRAKLDLRTGSELVQRAVRWVLEAG